MRLGIGVMDKDIAGADDFMGSTEMMLGPLLQQELNKLAAGEEEGVGAGGRGRMKGTRLAGRREEGEGGRRGREGRRGEGETGGGGRGATGGGRGTGGGGGGRWSGGGRGTGGGACCWDHCCNKRSTN